MSFIIFKFTVSPSEYADKAIGNLHQSGTVVEKDSPSILKVKFNTIEVSKSIYDRYNISDNIIVYHIRDCYDISCI